MVHIDTKKLDAGLVAATPQPTGFAYYQNDRNAYEVVLTLGNLEQSLEDCNAYVIWTYEDGSTTMQEAVVEPPQTIRHALSPALLAKAGQVVCTLVVYDEAASYRRTLGQWLCQVLPEAQEPTVPPEDPDIPIIQSLLLDAQRLNRETIAALGRAEEVEQGTEHARAAAQAAQAAAETAQTGALASQTAAEAARDAAATHAATAEEQAAAAAQSATRASDSATAAQVAKAGAEVAQTGAKTAQVAAEDARDETEAALGSRVPNTRTINGKTLDVDVVLTAGDVGAVARNTGISVTNQTEDHWTSNKWGAHRFNLQIIMGGENSRLSLKEGGVRIGAGITHVGVCGYVFLAAGDTSEPTRVMIYHESNGRTRTINGTFLRTDDLSYGLISTTASVIINVSEGDIIKLCMYEGNTSGQPQHIGAQSAVLTVWEV